MKKKLDVRIQEGILVSSTFSSSSSSLWFAFACVMSSRDDDHNNVGGSDDGPRLRRRRRRRRRRFLWASDFTTRARRLPSSFRRSQTLVRTEPGVCVHLLQ
jgi:hypothetical protein